MTSRPGSGRSGGTPGAGNYPVFAATLHRLLAPEGRLLVQQMSRGALVGEPTARVWRLYLAGGGLTFEEGRMGVDQILAVRRTEGGTSGMPAVRC
ncbi:hypothetical protein [Actinoplanes sp. NPDC026619]|uniref:hypothetical protein n=1 Tax=Actinoplanes sp. NPDC026619 TaxID=3155798 RepID=UPI0033E3F93A